MSEMFSVGPGKGKQMAAVSVEHGWLLVHDRSDGVQYRIAELAVEVVGCGQGSRACEEAEIVSLPPVLY